MPTPARSRLDFDYVNFETSLESKLSKKDKKHFRQIVRGAQALSFARGDLRFISSSPYVVGFIEGDWFNTIDGNGDVDIEYSDEVNSQTLKTIEETFSVYLRTVSSLMRRSLRYKVELTLHMETTDPHVRKFVRVSTAMAKGSYLPGTLGQNTFVKGLYIQLDKDSELTYYTPGHLDFTFTFQLNSADLKKGYLQTYLTKASSIVTRLR